MRIIIKSYNKKGKLVKLKGRDKNNLGIRFKVLKNQKEFPCCDFKGRCTNKAFAEVYPFLGKKSKRRGWSYLCKKHYYQELKKFNGKLPACLSVGW
jgi:hypothetical protein